jgi:hypothetical protein
MRPSLIPSSRPLATVLRTSWMPNVTLERSRTLSSDFCGLHRWPQTASPEQRWGVWEESGQASRKTATACVGSPRTCGLSPFV